MNAERFSDLCRKAAFYARPNMIGTPVLRGGITKKGDPWILTIEDDGFHVLPTRNLKAVEGSGQVTWIEDNGRPAFVIADLVHCEELNLIEAGALIDQARDYYAGASASAWLKQQLSDAETVTDLSMTYVPPDEKPVDPNPA